jgi:hypothetical protein
MGRTKLKRDGQPPGGTPGEVRDLWVVPSSNLVGRLLEGPRATPEIHRSYRAQTWWAVSWSDGRLIGIEIPRSTLAPPMMQMERRRQSMGPTGLKLGRVTPGVMGGRLASKSLGRPWRHL